jgi:hypothetical protein
MEYCHVFEHAEECARPKKLTNQNIVVTILAYSITSLTMVISEGK